MDIIDLTEQRKIRQAADQWRRSVDIKNKLDYYRSIWSNAPRHSDLEHQSLAKIATLVPALPDDDKEKIDYMRIVVDYYDKDPAVTATLFDMLKTMAPGIDDLEERLRVYRALLRSSHADDAMKITIGNVMLELLDNA